MNNWPFGNSPETAWFPTQRAGDAVKCLIRWRRHHVFCISSFQAKFPDTTIIFDMSLVYICVAFAGVLLNNLLVEQFSLSARITFGYVQAFVTLLTVALADVWFEVFDKRTAYNVNLIAVAAVAFGCTGKILTHYCDIIWALGRLKSLVNRLLVQKLVHCGNT